MIYPAVIGVDPGVTGAISVLRSNHVADVVSIPIVDGVIDVPYIVGWINQKTRNDPYIGEHKTVAYIEKVWGFSKGSIAVSKLNYIAGLMFGVISALDIQVSLVAPATWRKSVFGNFRATKQDALDYCIKYFPDIDFGKNHNKAEAVCIAEYGFILENGRWK